MVILLWTLAVAMVVIGLVGIVMPALPGHVLILGGLILAAWADGYVLGPSGDNAERRGST